MSAFNPWKALQGLVAAPPRQAGVVLAVDDGIASIELPGGGRLQAIGAAVVGQTVFVRDGVIEGDATDLPIDLVDI